MLRTLQLYISRELLKTFALTAVGLTLTFSLTGGVFNMMRAEVLTAVQMLHLMAFVLPFALTLTLPVAALFSCAMVYGRFAADNEFDACRASGINIRRLLAPAFVLSVFTAAFTFVFNNYVMPISLANVEQLVQKDLQKIIIGALDMQGYIKRGPMAFHAGEPPRSEQGPDGTRVDVDSAVFMHVQDEKLLKAGTADQVWIEFRTDPRTGDPIVEAEMHDVRGIDFQQNRLYTSPAQPLEPIAVPVSTFTEQKTKWLDLTELLRFRHDPTKLAPIQRQLAKLRYQARQALFYVYVVQQLNTGPRVLSLRDAGGKVKYEIQAGQAYHSPIDFRPQIDNATVKEHMEGYDREWRAERCTVGVARSLGSAPLVVPVRLAGRVTLTTQSPQRTQEKQDTDLDAVPLPQEVRDQEAGISDLDLLGLTEEHVRGFAQGRRLTEPPPSKFQLGNTVEALRLSTLGELATQMLQIVSEIHSRLVLSASALVMLVLAATLAIIFRGGHLLTAFVISFLPGLVVVVLNITGRRLAVIPDYHEIGLSVIWSGIALLAVADLVVLSKFLRR